MLLQPTLKRRAPRCDGISPTGRLRQTVARHTALHPRQRAVGAHAVTGRDEQRVAARLAAPYPAQLFTLIFQQCQRADGGVQRRKFAAQALLGHADGRYIDQQAEMAGDAETPRMRNAMSIDEDQPRLLPQLSPGGQQRRVFAKRQETRDIRHDGGDTRHLILHQLQRRIAQDGDGGARHRSLLLEAHVGAGDEGRRVGRQIVVANDFSRAPGVIVAMTLQEAEEAVRDMLAGNAFGDAGHRIVVEEFLDGEEASFIVMVDGENVVPMATSQDHKRVGDGDTGPNTGGMGAYSPAPVVTDEIHQRAMDQVIWPTVRGMAAEGNTYVGFLYAGLMISADGQPKVIEFNCRFGDPETQPIMLRLRSDLVELCLAGAEGRLNEKSSDWDERPALGVVLAAGGYPGDYRNGEVIQGLPQQESADGKVFHAGTRLQGDDVVTSGGRVLCVTALGDTVAQAQQRAYQLAEGIQWPGSFCRKDIGYRAIARGK